MVGEDDDSVEEEEEQQESKEDTEEDGQEDGEEEVEDEEEDVESDHESEYGYYMDLYNKKNHQRKKLLHFWNTLSVMVLMRQK